MYKLKNVAKRSSALVAAVSLLAGVGSTALPAFASADALNPLTERTLLLSSSSPGFHYVDGAGNATYAPPNSGPNGKKTGETFTFKPSTTTSGNKVKAFTFQYCTSAAGTCLAPGNDSGGGLAPVVARGVDTSTTSDLNVATSTPTEISSGNWTTISGSASKIPPADDSQGNFVVLKGGVYSAGWTMGASTLEDNATTATGKNNLITLKNTTGIDTTNGQQMQVIFFGTNGNYITNPGAGAFFVKINNYDSTTLQNFRDNYPTAATPQNVVDGGVTVANVMTDSIQIQTKVLETMSFSVGTVNPDTQAGAHTACDPISTNAPISLGLASAEYSLSTGTAYDGYSYWRLSSNSSNGATVYYSGYTLSNTEGDQIKPIYDLSGGHTFGDNSMGFSHTGSEQFGLGTDSTADTLDAGFTAALAANSTDPNWHTPTLAPLVATASYGSANGAISTNDAGAKFAFNKNANTVPEPVAAENSSVVNCATGKMRYMANIAATTPAGIYSSKINYLAAPEY
jgi:hypothetical protein